MRQYIGVEQMVRDVLEKACACGLIDIGKAYAGDDDDGGIVHPQQFTNDDLRGVANVLDQHLKHCQERWKASQSQAVEIPSHPTPEQIDSACLSYTHDFGLLHERSRSLLRVQANVWLLAWQKVNGLQLKAAPPNPPIVSKIPEFLHRQAVYRINDVLASIHAHESTKEQAEAKLKERNKELQELKAFLGEASE